MYQSIPAVNIPPPRPTPEIPTPWAKKTAKPWPWGKNSLAKKLQSPTPGQTRLKKLIENIHTKGTEMY